MKLPVAVLWLGWCCFGLTKETLAKNSVKANWLDKLALKLNVKTVVGYVIFNIHYAKTDVTLHTFLTSRPCGLIKVWKKYTLELDLYAHDYISNANKVLPELQKAEKKILKMLPKKCYEIIPMTVMVDDELTTIADASQEMVLLKILTRFEEIRFYMVYDSCKFISPVTKSFLNWFMANLIPGTLYKRKEDTTAVIDLQDDYAGLSFDTSGNKTVPVVDPESYLELNLYEKDYKIYSDGIYAYGVKRARKLILEEVYGEKTPAIFESPCLFPNSGKHEEQFNDKKYVVKGTQNGGKNSVNFDECQKIIRKVVKRFEKIPNLSCMCDQTVAPYYLRLVGKEKFGPEAYLEVSDVEEAARDACKKPNKDEPFRCMDTVYANVMLTDFYGIKKGQKLPAMKVKKAKLVDWTLGVCYLNLRRLL